jgi:YD repeat-containing protein
MSPAGGIRRRFCANATDRAWEQAFSYDGFGNLTGNTVTAGGAPSPGEKANSMNGGQ